MQEGFPSRLADFYPLARSLNRKLTLVIGPTNSGKTHEALERFRNTNSGSYLAPLRLLALEVRDSLTELGLPVSLVTGELLEIVPDARHCSSTIEMLNFSQQVDMAIIDEVQMIADPQRGSAWLQAVIGAPAKEVWMLGSPEAERTVLSLASYLNEPIEIIHTERLAPLEVSDRALPLDQIPKQAALIAFRVRMYYHLPESCAKNTEDLLRLFMERYPLRCAGNRREGSGMASPTAWLRPMRSGWD